MNSVSVYRIPSGAYCAGERGRGGGGERECGGDGVHEYHGDCEREVDGDGVSAGGSAQAHDAPPSSKYSSNSFSVYKLPSGAYRAGQGGRGGDGVREYPMSGSAQAHNAPPSSKYSSNSSSVYKLPSGAYRIGVGDGERDESDESDEK